MHWSPPLRISFPEQQATIILIIKKKYDHFFQALRILLRRRIVISITEFLKAWTYEIILREILGIRY